MPGVTSEQVPGYVEQMFDRPPTDANSYWVTFFALDQRLGLKGADQLLVRVSLEAALAYPLQTASIILQKAFEAYLNPLHFAVPLVDVFPPLPMEAFHPPLSDEIAAAGDFTDAHPSELDRAIDRNVRWTMRIAILMAILTLPIALRAHTWRVTIALLVFSLYLNSVIIIGTSPLFRYTIYAIPLALMCAFIGTVSVISALRPLGLAVYSKVSGGMKG
jgi:hypothetical protein